MDGYLINNSLLRKIASEAGFDLVNLFNCGELYELYRGNYGEALKKKATTVSIQQEQKEFVDLFQVGVFKLR